jgi:uncharacterized membrane protein (DUF106 family)
LYVLGDDPSGVLKFRFTLDPVAVKDFEKKMKKAADDGDSKKVERLKREAAKPVETLEASTITRQVSSETMANNLFDMLISYY